MINSGGRFVLWGIAAFALGGSPAGAQVVMQRQPPAIQRVPSAIVRRIQPAVGERNTSGVESLTLNPDAVFAGQISAITVGLAAPAAAAGTKVLLSATPANLATLPPSVTVAAGQMTATFDVATTAGGTDNTVTIQAWRDGATGKLSAPLKVVAALATVSSISLPTTVQAWKTATGTVVLSAAATGTGLTVTLTNSNPAALSVPASVAVPAGKNSATFALTGASFGASGTAAVSAELNASIRTANTTVQGGADVTSFTGFPWYVKAGTSVTGYVNIVGTGPLGGAEVPVWVRNAANGTVPQMVMIATGKTFGPLTLTAKSEPGTILIYKTAQSYDANPTSCPFGNTSCYSFQAVAPPTLAAPKFEICSQAPSTCQFDTLTVEGGRSLALRIGITGPLAEATVVALTSSNPSLASITPNVTFDKNILSSAQSPGFATKPVTSTAAVTFTISCTSCQAPSSYTRVLQIVPGPNVTAIAVSPSAVKGGVTTTGTVTIAKAAGPTGAKVDVTSSNATICVVPSFMIVPPGQTSGTFTITTKPVASTAAVTIGGSYAGGAVKTTAVQITP